MSAFVFETNLHLIHICSDAYQRVHKISLRAKIEKKSFVDLSIEGLMPQPQCVCLRETAAPAVREYKEFQKRSLFFICCILCLFSQKFATLDRQFCHHSGCQQARTPQGGVSVSSRHCLPTQILRPSHLASWCKTS